MFEEMARSAGKDVFIGRQLRSGTSLEEHLEFQETRNKINECQWDYVILQGSHYHIAFPEYHYYIEPPINEFKQIILANNLHTKIIFFMDWAMKNGVYFNGIHYPYGEFQDMIIEGTVILADKYNFLVSPIGSAWKTVVEERPTLELYNPDLGHPSYYGSYLEACVYFSTIFTESVVGNEYMGSLTENTALFLQEVASNTVLNNMELWNLTDYTGIESNNTSDHEIKLFPNPVVTSLYIRFEKSVSRAKITLFDIFSHVIFSSDEMINNNELEINMLPYHDNIYFLKIETSLGISVRKILK